MKVYEVHSYGINKVTIHIERYSCNDNLALRLVTDDYEPFASLTVNTDRKFDSRSQACVDTNNCPWAEKFIRDNELGIFTGEFVRSGRCEYPVYDFFLDKIDLE
ncbi:MAG: DUF4313 domain-containing protein [Firmicutes bacterium]|nr:DUF4313 domain-containing protein [Bacillota bacterium]